MSHSLWAIGEFIVFPELGVEFEERVVDVPLAECVFVVVV
jgi:hypothetical protein